MQVIGDHAGYENSAGIAPIALDCQGDSEEETQRRREQSSDVSEGRQPVAAETDRAGLMAGPGFAVPVAIAFRIVRIWIPASRCLLLVERTATALEELMSRELKDVRLAAMMIDGLQIGGRTHVVALGSPRRE